MSLINSEFLTPIELAKLKGVTVRTVQSWVSKGEAPPSIVEQGRRWFHRREAEAFNKPKRGPRND